jgi:hypothetical protein
MRELTALLLTVVAMLLLGSSGVPALAQTVPRGTLDANCPQASTTPGIAGFLNNARKAQTFTAVSDGRLTSAAPIS